MCRTYGFPALAPHASTAVLYQLDQSDSEIESESALNGGGPAPGHGILPRNPFPAALNDLIDDEYISTSSTFPVNWLPSRLSSSSFGSFPARPGGKSPARPFSVTRNPITSPSPSHVSPGISSHALDVCHVDFQPPGIQSQCGIWPGSVFVLARYSSDDHVAGANRLAHVASYTALTASSCASLIAFLGVSMRTITLPSTGLYACHVESVMYRSPVFEGRFVSNARHAAEQWYSSLPSSLCANVCDPVGAPGVHSQSAYITLLISECVCGFNPSAPRVLCPFHVNANVGALYSYVRSHSIVSLWSSLSRRMTRYSSVRSPRLKS